MLTKDDLEKIRNVMKSEVELISIRIDKLESMIENLTVANQREHREILRKIEQIKNMKTEDIEAIADDVTKLEKRVSRLEAKTT